MAYTTSTLVSNYLQRALTADESALLSLLIPAIKKWIDLKTGSTFDQASATTRYYDGGSQSVDIDPATDITEVSLIDNDNVEEQDYTLYTDYVLEPQNENVKREIVKRSGKFPSGLRRIAVTAKFSEYDSGIPEDIQMVATRLAANLIQSGTDVNTSNIQSESLEGHTVYYGTSQESISEAAANDPLIMSTLEQRRELFVG